MSSHDDLGARKASTGQPLGDLMLAQALEACIRAERAHGGSSAEIIEHAPASQRAELQRLMVLVHELESSVHRVTPAPEFRVAARARVMATLGGQADSPFERGAHLTTIGGPARGARRRPRRWVVRVGAGLLVALMATSATVTASASALPGDPLYGLKQAQEELSLRLASDDPARVLAHLRRADARLDETARLLEQGRTSEAVDTAQRYDQSVERATTTFVVTIDFSDAARPNPLETKLGEQQDRLEAILQVAPAPARPDLREALATTERGRELMADPRPVERALGRRPSRAAAAAAAVPTSHVEEQPTPVPTLPPTAVSPNPTSIAVLARHEDQDADLEAGAVARASDGPGSSGDREADVENDNEDQPQVALRPNSGNSGQGTGRGQGASVGDRGSGQSRGQDGQGEDAPRVARNDATAGSGDGGDGGREADAVAAQRSPDLRSADRGGDDDRRPSDIDSEQGDDRGRGQNTQDNRPVVAEVTLPPVAPATEARNPGPSESGNTGNAGATSGSNSGTGGGEGGVHQTPVEQVAPTDDRAAGPATSIGPTNSAPSGQARATATPTPTVRRSGGDGKSGDIRTGQTNSGDSGVMPEDSHKSGSDDADR